MKHTQVLNPENIAELKLMGYLQTVIFVEFYHFFPFDE